MVTNHLPGYDWIIGTEMGPVFLGISFVVFLCFFWCSVPGYWKKCRGHKDGTNAEAAVGFFFGYMFLVLCSLWQLQNVPKTRKSPSPETLKACSFKEQQP